MAPVKNGRILFASHPDEYPIPGKDIIYDESESIDLENVPLNGGFLIKALVLSIDPYMRGKMRKVADVGPSYEIGKPLDNDGVALVLRSDHPDVKVGDHIFARIPFQHYTILQRLKGENFARDGIILANKENLPWSAYCGVAGIPGQTAYCAWKEYANPLKGEVAFVSAAAGSVGSFAVQLAKADGLKVIACAGSDEKVDFVKSLGVDYAFNYKKEDTAKVLEKEGPVDIYWDNVGGPTLDAALANAASGARFIECGMISGYNVQGGDAIRNLSRVVWSEIKLYGFLVGRLLPKYADAFYMEVPGLVREGKLKYLEDRTQGLEYAGRAIEAVQRGINKGKSVVIVAEEF
ncbi:alcohol dehydrogenase [Irpex rosettiformis]|uniref:Alcohol dehydrogenase n=1 Tax=Irpex rosettiformis TaxID=378272 RepID=A0ACB8U1W1_9APHY|nr:alcohol dehydrogenase [Irpex rosettiformis]